MSERSEGALVMMTRPAQSADASALALMCRRCFRKSPEWFVPLFLVRSWWRGLIADSSCPVEVVEYGDRMVGYLVTTESHARWRRQLGLGPHRRAMKLMVLLTRPAFLKSFFHKRLRANRPTGDVCSATESGQKQRAHPVRDRVTPSGVLQGRRGLYLAIMAMDPDSRGLGGGKLLVERFIELGQSQGLEVLWLHVDPRNERAQGLYAGYGFSIAGVDGSSLLMVRNLTCPAGRAATREILL